MSELNSRLKDWIQEKSVRLVDEITNGNFVYYESLKRPMVLLFLDRESKNAPILRAMKAVAKRYQVPATLEHTHKHNINTSTQIQAQT